jgi:uncharacterized protein involved in exopolysaccharide biosynthesis
MSELNSENAKMDVEVDPTLRDVLTPLFRRRRLLTLSFLGIFLGGILSAVVTPKQYDAHMKILVKRERVDPIVTSEATLQEAQPAPAVTEEEINSEAEILRSRDLLEKVVLATGLQEKRGTSIFGFLSQADDPETQISKAVDQLGRKLQIEALTKTDLIEVGYQSPDPLLSQRVLAALADLYMEKHLAVHRPPGAFDFFQQETEQYRDGLTEAEARLARFGKDQNVTVAQTERDLTVQKLNEFDATFHQTEAGIAETQGRIGDLESQLKVTPPRLNTSQKSTDDGPALQVLEGTLSTLELKHTDMAAHFEPEYQPLKDLEAQIAQTRSQIAKVRSAPLHEETTDVNPAYTWLTEELVKSRADLVTLEARATANSRNVQIYRQMALDLGQKQLEQEDLIRNAKVEEGDFLLYLNKREEARISDALDSKRILNVAVAEAATVPALPTRSPWLLVFLGGLLAILVSTASAFVADYVDPSLRTVADVEKVLQVPILAAMPKTQRA